MERTGRIGDGPSLTKDVCKPEFDVSSPFSTIVDVDSHKDSRTRRWSRAVQRASRRGVQINRTVAGARVDRDCAPARDRAGRFARLERRAFAQFCRTVSKHFRTP